MSRLFWIVMMLIGGGLAYLLLAGERGMPLGLSGDQFAETLYLGALGLVIAAGVVGLGMGFRGLMRGVAIWAAIFLVLVGGYQYRYELQDIASRLTAGLIPGSPLSLGQTDGRVAVALQRLGDGQFVARGAVNGAPVTLLVDTGASSTVLTADDARKAGIDHETLSFTVPIMTANGRANAAHAIVEEISIGDIIRTDMPVLVADPAMLDQSLLGMNFINSLTAFDIRGDRLTLVD